MLYLAVFFTILLFPLGLSAQGNVMNSYYDDKRYDFEFTCEQLEKAQSWTEEQPHPPLAPRVAVSTAKKQLTNLVSNAKNWELNKISLRSACSDDKWFYVIELIPPGEGLKQGLGVVVLMNKKTIDPKISDWPPTP